MKTIKCNINNWKMIRMATTRGVFSRACGIFSSVALAVEGPRGARTAFTTVVGARPFRGSAADRKLQLVGAMRPTNAQRLIV